MVLEATMEERHFQVGETTYFSITKLFRKFSCTKGCFGFLELEALLIGDIFHKIMVIDYQKTSFQMSFSKGF